MPTGVSTIGLQIALRATRSPVLLDILKIIFGDGNSSNPSKTGLDRIRELGGTVFDESIPADAARKHSDKNSGWI